MGPLYLRTLGELRLTSPEGEVLGGQRKLLALLAYLALTSPSLLSESGGVPGGAQ